LPNLAAVDLEKILCLFETVEAQLETVFFQSAGASLLTPRRAAADFITPIASAGSVS